MDIAKRILSAMLVLSMVLAMMPVCAQAEETTAMSEMVVFENQAERESITADATLPPMVLYESAVSSSGVAWRFEETTGTLTISGNGMVGSDWTGEREKVQHLVVESGITGIGNEAFLKCINLISVALPEGLAGIGGRAFASCKKLAELHLPDTLTYLGKAAFSNCESLSKIVIPGSLKEIGESAFYGCRTKKIILSEGVETIGEEAFALNHITDLHIPNSVTTIGSRAFRSCTSLASVTIPDGVVTIGDGAFSSCVTLPRITIPGSVVSFGNGIFTGCENLTSAVIVEGATSIGESMFSACKKLNSVTIPDSVTTIGSSAFSSCESLTKPVLTEKITVIGEKAFYQCNGLTEIVIPNSVTTLGPAAFAECDNISKVTFGDGLCVIGGNAFYRCGKLAEIQWGSNIQEIGTAAFYGNSSLPEVMIPDTVTSIGAQAFQSCRNLAKVVICGSAVTIGIKAFSYCEALASITLKEGVTSIDSEAFSECENLSNIVIPNSVTAVGRNAFASCHSLTTVTIGSGCAELGAEDFRSFSNCSKLENYHVAENNPYFCSPDGVLYTKDMTRLIHYPGAMTSDYVIPEGVTAIEADAFSYAKRLTSITIPVSVTRIGSGAFSGCSNLDSVVYAGSSDQWERVDKQYGNSILDSVDITFGAENNFGGTVGTIPEITDKNRCGENAAWSFDNETKTLTISGVGPMYNYRSSNKTRPWTNCYGIKTVVISENITRIGDYAFQNNSSIEKIEIAGSVNSIGERAFYDCDGIQEVNIHEGVVEICKDAFQTCDNLPQITIPGSVKIIGDSAFAVCKELTEVVLSEGVSQLGVHAFAFCPKLPSITIPASVTSMGSGAFAGCSMLNEITVSKENEHYYVNNQGILFGVEPATLLLAPKSFSGSYTVPDHIMSIGEYAFSACNLTNIIFPEGLLSIEAAAFSGCPLTSITIPDSVLTLGDHAFSTTKLERLTLGKSLEIIGSEAFWGCDALTSVAIPDSVRTIKDHAFHCCYKLAHLDLGHGIITIGAEAFNVCRNLTEVTIPDSVQYIDALAFRGCENLVSVTFEGGDLKFESQIGGAFEDCTSLASVTFPERMEGLELYGTFQNCGLLSVKLPVGTTVIGDSTFGSCKDLVSVEIPDTVTDIQEGAFAYCASLKTLRIPYGITWLDRSTFGGCSSLESVMIPDSVVDIYEQAFSGCSALKDVYYGGTQVQWTDIDIDDYGNGALEKATIHYSSPLASASTYRLAIEPEKDRHTVLQGDSLTLTCRLYRDSAAVTNWDQPGLSVGHIGYKQVVTYGGWEKTDDGGYQLTLEGCKPGTATLTIFDAKTGAVGVSVVDVEVNLVDFVDNSAIRINGSGSAFAYYQCDPDITCKYTLNGVHGSARSNENGIICIPLGNFEAPGTFESTLHFTQVGSNALEPVISFRPTVIATDLEYSQEWQVSFDATVGASLSAGAEVKAGDFKVKALLGKIGANANGRRAITATRSISGGKVTLEMLSDTTVGTDLQFESGIGADILVAEVDVANVSAKAEAAITGITGLKIKDYTPDNPAQKQAIGAFLLGEITRMYPDFTIMKQFYKVLRETAFREDTVITLNGESAVAGGSFGADIGGIEVNDEELFTVIEAEIEGSVTNSNLSYSNGVTALETSYNMGTSLALISGSLPGEVSANLLSMEYLGSDTSVKLENTNGRKTLETTSINGKKAHADMISLGKNRTTDYSRYTFHGESLRELTSKYAGYHKFTSGGKTAVSTGDIKNMAVHLSENKVPAEYTKLEEIQQLYSLPVDVAFSMGIGFNFGFEMSYLQAVEHEKERGYAVDGTLLLSSVPEDHSNAVSGKIVRLETLVTDAFTSLKEKAAAFFKSVTDSIKNGAATVWGWISGKENSNKNWTVSLTAPDGEEAWGSSETVEISCGGRSVMLQTAKTLGRAFVVGVTDSDGMAVTDLSDDPLKFTIRYAQEDLKVAGVSDTADISIFRYSDNGDYFELVGGTRDNSAMTVTAEINKPGQYILIARELDDQESEDGEILWGDASGDGKVNAMDATRILRYAAKLITEDKIDLIASDVNSDGKVNAMDATRILRYSAKLITELKVRKELNRRKRRAEMISFPHTQCC